MERLCRSIGSKACDYSAGISTPLMSIALALLYYDARVRQEGLDLQIMMDALDAPSADMASPRPSTVS